MPSKWTTSKYSPEPLLALSLLPCTVPSASAGKDMKRQQDPSIDDPEGACRTLNTELMLPEISANFSNAQSVERVTILNSIGNCTMTRSVVLVGY
ncbi:hypothetical protein BDP27DRAFT_1426967 [Rhodocollybia butyracea]|uniref:Secreted protein n=1 Tax=Rhodocollybia butyracea TaxID=206335 RepID=A0A9P5PD05_9AGAR|nr:hypothetical protein BDP27DRAFT_1426967 [Rhodocollybia butyracea]